MATPPTGLIYVFWRSNEPTDVKIGITGESTVDNSLRAANGTYTNQHPFICIYNRKIRTPRMCKNKIRDLLKVANMHVQKSYYKMHHSFAAKIVNRIAAEYAIDGKYSIYAIKDSNGRIIDTDAEYSEEEMRDDDLHRVMMLIFGRTAPLMM